MNHLNQPKMRECTASDLMQTKDGRGIMCCNCGASEKKFHSEQWDDPHDFSQGLDLLTRIVMPGFAMNSFENIIMKGELL